MNSGKEIEQSSAESVDTVHDLRQLQLEHPAQSPSLEVQEALRLRDRLIGLHTEVGAALAGVHPIHQALQRCTDALFRQMGVACARLWTLERGEQVLVLQAGSGVQGSRPSRVALGRLKVGQVGQTAHPILTNDLAHEPRSEDREWASREGFTSFAAHPLIADGRVVGVLAVSDQRPLPETTLDELAAVAAAIAQFVESQRIERERAVLLAREREARARAEDAVRQTAFLARASLTLDACVDQSSALEQMACLAVPALADWCLIDLVEEGELLCRFRCAGAGLEKVPTIPGDDFPSYLSKLILQSGESLLFPECSNVTLFLEIADRVAHSLMAVALCARGRLFGMMILVSTRPDRRYTDVDLALAEDFVHRCSLTLDMLRLVEQARREVTERRWAEAALLRSEEHLRQTQKMEAVGRLAGGIAHDFNNLLTAMMGYSEMLLHTLSPTTPEHEMAQAMWNVVERADQLTRQLLTFSRKRTTTLSVVSLNSLLNNLEGMLRRLIRADIELITTLDPRLKTVRADPSKLEQVIVNLVVNACDAMRQGGLVTIQTRNIDLDSTWEHLNARSGPHVILEVRDTGTGMTEEVRARLFEPFFTTKPLGEGTGLGLAILYDVVQQAGGFIDVRSEPGQGSCFQVYLPTVGEEQRAESEKTGTTSPVASPAPVVKTQGNVLLAEDDEVTRMLVSRVLRAAGYTVLEAAHGDEALRRATEAKRIDLLVADVIMPRLGARELAERLLERWPELKVLYLSGHIDNAIVQTIVSGGAEFLEKPFRPEELIGKVRQVLAAAH
jgi:signal transduction histidine kinase